MMKRIADVYQIRPIRVSFSPSFPSYPRRSFFSKSWNLNAEKSYKEVIFSGIQPTGCLTLGNYLGVIQNWLKLQNEAARSTSNQKKLLFCIVDLHSMSSIKNDFFNRIQGQEIRERSAQNPSLESNSIHEMNLETAITLLACGIDPVKCILFEQSKIEELTLLTWILGSITPISWLEKMIQFKEKSEELKAISPSLSPSLALLSYPVLQASDILLYRTTLVPVGEDQRQHIELARKIAHSFNSTFGEYFPIPQALYPNSTTQRRVMSLSDGRSKMSKSSPNDWSRINLRDDPQRIAEKIRRAKTDTITGISYEPNSRPEISNLVAIYAALSAQPIEEICEKFRNSPTSEFKNALIALITANIGPIAKQIQALREDRSYVKRILEEGAASAKEIAIRNMHDIAKLVGLSE